MNLVRAMFWAGVVIFLTPHEPDVGLGRPLSLLGAGAIRTNDTAPGLWADFAHRLAVLRRDFAERDSGGQPA